MREKIQKLFEQVFGPMDDNHKVQYPTIGQLEQLFLAMSDVDEPKDEPNDEPKA